MTFLRVQVIGDKNVQRALSELNLKVKDLHRAWQRIGAKVRQDAIPMTPVLSGRLVNSIRAGGGKTRAVVRAGKPSMEPYAPIQHYGGYNNIEGKHFLTVSLHKNEDYAEREVSQEIGRIIDAAGLD